MFQNSGCEIVFETLSYKLMLTFFTRYLKYSSTIKTKILLTVIDMQLKLFDPAYRFKSFKVKLSADPLHQNRSDFLGGKKFCTYM
jgi:hypothetical protein